MHIPSFLYLSIRQFCELVKITGDGSCLFAAVAHQLFEYRVDDTFCNDNKVTRNGGRIMQAHRTSVDFPVLEGTTDDESVVNLLNVFRTLSTSDRITFLADLISSPILLTKLSAAKSERCNGNWWGSPVKIHDSTYYVLQFLK